MKLLCISLILILMLPSCQQDQSENVESKNNANPKFSTLTTNEVVAIDKSPMDAEYFPVDFAKLRMTNKTLGTEPEIRILYSRPQKMGREVFGSLIPYNQPWRLGANENTEIEFFKNVEISGKLINKGKYSIYCIPRADTWDICLNKNLYTWGLDIDSSKDVLRTTVDVGKLQKPVEHLSIYFDRAFRTPVLRFTWDLVDVRLPITLK